MPIDLAVIAGSQIVVFTLGYVLCVAVPGPNLLVVAGVAATEGWRGSIPICAGVTVGSVALAGCVAYAASFVPEGAGWERAGRALSGACLLYVAWMLLRTRRPTQARKLRGEAHLAVGFGTAFVNPITGAFFASQFLSLKGAGDGDLQSVALAIVGVVTLARNLLVALLLGGLAKGSLQGKRSRGIRRAVGAAFLVLGLWMLVPAAIVGSVASFTS
jgi:threonine/homoserine/homoserine lactone efflux protein